MVLNSNGISGVAHRWPRACRAPPIRSPTSATPQKRGLPTIIQYAKGYGPAARKLAKIVGNVQFVTPLDGITPVAGRQGQADRHPRHVAGVRYGVQASLAAITSSSEPAKTLSWPESARARARLVFQAGSFQHQRW